MIFLFFVGCFLGSTKKACKMLKLWVLEFDRVDTWRAAAAGAFPPSFNCTQLPPGVILCAKHWLSSWAFVTIAAGIKQGWRWNLQALMADCLVFDLFPIEWKSLSLILNRPMICNLADLHNCFYTLLKEQLVRLHCHLLLTLVDLVAILSWNCLWGFVSLWKTAVSCIQVLENVGEKKPFPCRTMTCTCTPLSVTAVQILIIPSLVNGNGLWRSRTGTLIHHARASLSGGKCAYVEVTHHFIKETVECLGTTKCSLWNVAEEGFKKLKETLPSHSRGEMLCLSNYRDPFFDSLSYLW